MTPKEKAEQLINDLYEINCKFFKANTNEECANRYKLLSNVRLFAVFDNPEAAWMLSTSYDPNVNFLDVEYPVDADMATLIGDFVVKQLIEKMK